MFETGTQFVPPFMEDSHRVIFPVYPLSKSVPLFAPLQTVALEVSIPPMVAGLTVIVVGDELAIVQFPLCTTALYNIV